MYNYVEISENIKQQRYLRKLTQEELASLSGIALPTIKKIEGGKSGIRISTIQAIAAALEIDMEKLFQPARRLRTIHFRTCKHLRTKEGIITDIINKLDHYNALEKHTGKMLHPLYKRAYDAGTAQTTAALCRKLAGLNDTSPVADVALALTTLGVKTFTLTINTEKFFSLSAGEIDGGPVIIINDHHQITYEQRAFSAAHELGHLILHKNKEKSVTDAVIWAEEDEADLFASYFLMPEKGLAFFWEASQGLRWTERIIKVKHIFGVSYKTVINRLGDFKSLNKRFIKDYSGNIKEQKDPEPLNKELYIESRLCWLAAVAARDGKITATEAAAIIGTNVNTVSDYIKELDD